MEQVQKLLSRTIPKMIEIKLVLSDDLASVNADPVQVEQVLMNLAVNAKDAMQDGGKLTHRDPKREAGRGLLQDAPRSKAR